MTKHFCDKCGKDISSNANRYVVHIFDGADDNPFRSALQNSAIGVNDANGMMFCKDCARKIIEFIIKKEVLE